MSNFPTLTDIKNAANRIEKHIHRTSVLRNAAIDEMIGARVFFKCENFQKVGAFKARGAINAVLSLTDEEAVNGVATHSSGNHAAALALAAGIRGIPAYIVMPENAPQVKKNAVSSYGAEISYCTSTLKAREDTLDEVIKKTGAVFIPPFNDYRIINGQATAALELLEEVDELDVLIAPVGGGGLLSGTALSAYYISPTTSVLGAEPKGADDAYHSLKAGMIIPSDSPKTIADGLLTSLGNLAFE
ncbi:MAG: pyridoxal-phosphate dependent enzyme, partial [Kordiimonadaceae bacterium]|nr:pyridoxal-phosphate dependent enzyme [Kordiimonadaceae bacterium]